MQGKPMISGEDILLKSILEKVKSRLYEIYKDDLVEVLLYGSQARGEAGSGSDIDIAVVLKKKFNRYEESDRIIDGIYDISLEYDQLISVLPLSNEEYMNGIYPIYENIRKEGVVV